MSEASDTPQDDPGVALLCSYTLLPNAVHEFVFQESSRAAVNQWIDQLVHLLDTAPKASVLPIVVDTRQSGMLPIAYVIQKLRDVYLNSDHRPSMRLAFLPGNNALMVFVQLLAEIAASNEGRRVEYHQSHTQDEAFAWLLATE